MFQKQVYADSGVAGLSSSPACRYGYRDVEELSEVVRKYQDAKIPLDTMWTDIDYMDQWKDFTLNQSAFSKSKMQAHVFSHSVTFQSCLGKSIQVQHFLSCRGISKSGFEVERDMTAAQSSVKADHILWTSSICGVPKMTTSGPVFFKPSTYMDT